MPPDTMTLAGHALEIGTLVCQHASDRSATSSSSSMASSSSLWSGGLDMLDLSRQSTSVTPVSPGAQFFVHSYVPHCQQHFNWDCGLACVQMILLASGFTQSNYRLLRQFCSTTSIWTVDLAHLLRRFGMEVSFFTVTLGSNPAYANESFYMENMEDDERRVSQLFGDAAHVGIAVQQRSISSEELQSWMLSGSCLIVVLVDKRKLDPWLAAADMCLPALCGLELGYTGHYILLVGYDAVRQEYVVRDPAAHKSDLRISAAALDAARRSFGTDEDILVVGCSGLRGGSGEREGLQVPTRQGGGKVERWGGAENGSEGDVASKANPISHHALV